jgi:hypothetical protein
MQFGPERRLLAKPERWAVLIDLNSVTLFVNSIWNIYRFV